MPFFNVGDKVKHPYLNTWCEVVNIDTTSEPIPLYTLKDSKGEFKNYCVGWVNMIDSDDVLRYGEMLTDDIVFGTPKEICTDYIRIRTISYDNRIFYHKMVNGEVVEFKELTK